MNRKTLCGVLLVSGTVLLTLGMLGDRALSDAMGGMLVGAGSGLLAMGGAVSGHCGMTPNIPSRPARARSSSGTSGTWPSAVDPRLRPARPSSGR